MRMSRVLLLSLVVALVNGDQMEEGGERLEPEGRLPQPDPMRTSLGEIFVSGMEAMPQLSQQPFEPIAVNDFSNFFTQESNGGFNNNEGAKSDQGDFGNSLGDYTAPHAPPLRELTSGHLGSSSNIYGSPSNGNPSPGYELPSSSFGTASEGYDSPSTGYFAPSSSYGVPSESYGVPSSSYDVPLTHQSLTPDNPTDGSYGGLPKNFTFLLFFICLAGFFGSLKGQDLFGDYSYDAPMTGYGHPGDLDLQRGLYHNNTTSLCFRTVAILQFTPRSPTPARSLFPLTRRI